MRNSVYLFIGLMLFACLAVLPRPVLAVEDHFAGAAVKWYSKSYEHIDIAHYVNKARDIFFTEEFKAKHPMAALFEGIFEVAGYFSIEDYECEAYMAHGKCWSKEKLWFNEDYPDSFVYRWYSVPNCEFAIDSFLTEDDYVLLLSLTGVKEKSRIFIDYMRDVGGVVAEMEGGDSDIQMGLGFLQMFELNQELLDSLGNEMDLVLFDVPDVTQEPEGPEWVNAAVMVPVANYEGAKRLLGMVCGMTGSDVSKPGFNTVEWDFYPIAGTSAAFGLNSEWMVICTDYLKFAEFARNVPNKMHEDFPCGSMYIGINVDRLYDELGMPLLTMLKSENPRLADKEIGYFFDVYPETDLGRIEILQTNWCNHVVFETEMDDDVLNLIGYAVCIGLEHFTMMNMDKPGKGKGRMKKKGHKRIPEGKFGDGAPF
jgi:hypothetical protein